MTVTDTDLNIFIPGVNHSYTTSLMIPWRKCFWSHMSHCKKGEETQSKPQLGGSHCGSQWVYVWLWFRNHATRMPSMSTTLVILMLFVSTSCIHSCWFSVACPVILALKALCKLQGGPLWCLAESDPVLLLGCTDRITLLFSAELQDHWLKSTHTYQKTSAISHVYLTWATPGQSVLWWSPWMNKPGPNIRSKRKGGGTENKGVIDLLSLFPSQVRILTASFPASQHHCCSSSLAKLHGMNETNYNMTKDSQRHNGFMMKEWWRESKRKGDGNHRFRFVLDVFLFVCFLYLVIPSSS